MRAIIAGLNKGELAKYIRANFPSIKLVRTKPDFVLCYGGDGTLLYAEREHPGVPKVMIRNSRVCAKCARETRETILALLTEGKYFLQTHQLLEAKIGSNTLYGLNDIIIGHAAINTSLRYQVQLNGEQYGNEYIGDGVIVSTPLGSTGYYQSVTQSTFQDGLGIAFNNTVHIIGHLVVSESTEIKIKVNRGPAVVVADNAKKFIEMDKGAVAVIKQSHRSTDIVYFKGKRYWQYNMSLGVNREPLGYCQICTTRISE